MARRAYTRPFEGLAIFLLALVFFAEIPKSTFALLVQRPCCSAFPHAGASFGPQLPWVSPGVMGVLSRSEDKDCSGAVQNTIVMIDRGLESFYDAVKACQEKGVVAVVVRNVASAGGGENDLIVMGSAQHDSTIRIPSVFVSRKAGDELDVLLAMNPTVFVELFAADDVNSIMAYIAYLIMSVETMFFGCLFFAILVFMRFNNRSCLRCCRKRDNSNRVAILVNDSSLIEPLQPNAIGQQPLSRSSSDPESKPPKDRHNGEATVQAYPVVFDANTAQEHNTVSFRVDPTSDEPVFEQQEQ